MASGEARCAVRECIARYGGLIWSIARRMLTHDQADAEDATQEIFVDLWKSAPRFDPSIASEATFIATIARRTADRPPASSGEARSTPNTERASTMRMR